MSDIIYLSKQGYEDLKDELHKLKTVDRPHVINQIAEARDKGDLSENAEYDAAKEAQGLLEARIAKLEADLSNSRIIDESKFYEVLLLTDISHSLPIKLNSSEFFCNAKASVRSGYIICTYNHLVWTEEIEENEIFYTSGLGGIYPKDIEVGYVSSIEIIDPTQTNIEIKLLANPLNGDMFGVLKY